MRSLILAVACTLPGQSEAPRDDNAGDPVAEYVARFLDETIREDRFSKAHHMEFHIEVDYPEPKPAAYAVGAKYRHWVDPPLFRVEGEIGPYEPSKQSPVKFQHIWDGRSQSALTYNPDGRQSSAVVSRGGEPRQSARRNRFWTELGIPSGPYDFEEASHGSYWLRGAVSSRNGYVLSSESVIIGGTNCIFVHKGDEDRIWFSVDAPIRLIKRDCWRTVKSPNRRVIEFEGYSENGLPTRIRDTGYVPVDRIGDPSRIFAVETVSLDLLEFTKPPKEDFILNPDDGVAVLDDKTMMSFQTERAGAPPFEKLLRQSRDPAKFQLSSRRNWLIDVNLVVLSVVALTQAYRRWKRR